MLRLRLPLLPPSASARAVAFAALAAILSACQPTRVAIDESGPTANWPQYAGSNAGLSFSPLTQISSANVKSLALAWEHHSGDFGNAAEGQSRTSFSARPIVPNDTLYFCTAL